MMGRQAEPAPLFYDFCLDDHVPGDHILRQIDVFLDLGQVRQELKPSERYKHAGDAVQSMRVQETRHARSPTPMRAKPQDGIAKRSTCWSLI